MSTAHLTIPQPANEAPAAWLMGLAAAGALTPEQAHRLIDGWFELDQDTFHQPVFRSIGEHVRAFIGDFPKA